MRLRNVIVFCLSFLSLHSFLLSVELHLVTVATERRLALDVLEQSADLAGFKTQVLGLGWKWECVGSKFVWMKEYLMTLPDEDIVLFVDGYDVLILGEKEDFLTKFIEIGFPLIVSTERNLWPSQIEKERDAYPHSRTSFRYVNSGGYIGRVKFLKKMFHEMNYSSGYFDDQEYLHHYFLEHQDDVYLDRNAEFFLSLFSVSTEELRIDMKRKRVYVEETHSTPLSIHGNGYSGKPIYEFIAKLFYLDKNAIDFDIKPFDYSPDVR